MKAPAQVADSLEALAAFIEGNDAYALRTVAKAMANSLGSGLELALVERVIDSLDYKADELRKLAKELRG